MSGEESPSEIEFGGGNKIKFNSENKAVLVNPSLPGNSPVPGVSIKKGQLVEVVPVRDFSWACKGNRETNSYNWVGPGGDGHYETGDERHMLPGAPFCGLIGRVGGGEWHYLGNSNTFTADDSGNLYLTANDVTPSNCPLSNKSECYSDNKGTPTATVTVNIKK